MNLLLKDPRTDVNRQDSDGWTPLRVAADNGHLEVVRVLFMGSGIDVNMQDLRGKTPLMAASGNGHVKVVKILLNDTRTLVNMQDYLGKTALHSTKIMAKLSRAAAGKWVLSCEARVLEEP